MQLLSLADGDVSKLDDVDYYWAKQFGWHLNEGYAHQSGYQHSIFLHIEVSKRMQIWAPNLIIKHRDGELLNNQRYNLRAIGFTKPKNINNTSGYIGVHLDANGKYIAQIGVNQKTMYLGYFSDKVDAAKAFDKAAKFYRGDDAVLNFPYQEY